MTAYQRTCAKTATALQLISTASRMFTHHHHGMPPTVAAAARRRSNTAQWITVVALVLVGCAGAAGPAAADATPAGPEDAAGWQALYDGLPYRGDGNFSTRLPDGRSAWVTGDAIPRDGGTWASNTVTVVDGIGSWQTPNVLPDVDGVKSWLGPVAIVDGKLVALVSRVRHVDAWPGFEPVGTAVASMRLGAGEWWPTVEQVVATPWSADSVNWTAGIYPYCGYVYIFGTRQIPGTPAFDVYLARMPTADLHTVSAWRYWVSPGRWTTGTPAPILAAGTDSAFSVRRSSAGWHLYTRHDGAHGEFVGYPGRWTWKPRGTEDGYLPASHPEVRLASGRLLVTLNVAGAGARFLEV